MLLRTLASERISPSYLFEGTDSLALHEAARAFAAGLLADSPPGEPEGRAMAQALAGSHADLHELRKDKATVISVAALGPVLERAHSTPFESKYQVFIIDPAEAMDPAGIARYLKSLEEPPASTVFILVTTRAERLPDTVLSRCRRVRFPPLAAAAIAALLREGELDEGSVARAVRAAGGSLERARRFAEHDLPTLAHSLIEAAGRRDAVTVQTADEALGALERAATTLAAAEGQETSTKRQHVRALVADLLRILMVEARESAAGRESALPATVDADGALTLLTEWGGLSAAVAANVTPAAILIESMAVLRRQSVRHLSR
jgi:DNA polymerase III gamma/tau subunit